MNKPGDDTTIATVKIVSRKMCVFIVDHQWTKAVMKDWLQNL